MCVVDWFDYRGTIQDPDSCHSAQPVTVHNCETETCSFEVIAQPCGFHPCRFRSSYTIVIPLPCSDHLNKYINQVQQAWNDVLENTMVDDLKKIELPSYELLVKDAIMSY